ncbi:hypothetical protein AGR7A_Lc140057 [Agrobacterium deltaense NCPPB 1641]|uniref:Uncharacterized protein n=1 Tax=Agrobacterium deltaense NCPPB 1641 TaxID=1183425 RepID=A0A1S7U2J7_9HYPH|nr:hypothetical protein AGR7A_Lc140057 [Agrobacterium deltaense NCPPB 1641]
MIGFFLLLSAKIHTPETAKSATLVHSLF